MRLKCPKNVGSADYLGWPCRWCILKWACAVWKVATLPFPCRLTQPLSCVVVGSYWLVRKLVAYSDQMLCTKKNKQNNNNKDFKRCILVKIENASKWTSCLCLPTHAHQGSLKNFVLPLLGSPILRFLNYAKKNVWSPDYLDHHHHPFLFVSHLPRGRWAQLTETSAALVCFCCCFFPLQNY